MEYALSFLTLREATQLRACSKEARFLVAEHPWEEAYLVEDVDAFFSCFPNAKVLYAHPQTPFRISPTVEHLHVAHADLYEMPPFSGVSFRASFCRLHSMPTMANLTTLNLSDSFFDPELLKGFPAVKELNVSRCPVKAKHLLGFPSCFKLVARNCALTDEFVPFMPLLKTLDLLDTVGHFDVFPPLLEDFTAPIGALPDLDFPHLKRLKCSFVSNTDLSHPTLQHLVVDGGAVEVFKLPNLQTLTLCWSNLEPLRDLTRLKKLTVAHCYFENPVVLGGLDLLELEVQRCDLNGALSFLKPVPKLRILCCDVAVLPPCGELVTCACVSAKHGLRGAVACA